MPAPDLEVHPDGADAVTFEARLPDDPPSWVIDAERAIAAGPHDGTSRPGFLYRPRLRCRTPSGLNRSREIQACKLGSSARPCCASSPS